jgi:ribosome-associated translation inhibitor RaiA
MKFGKILSLLCIVLIMIDPNDAIREKPVIQPPVGGRLKPIRPNTPSNKTETRTPSPVNSVKTNEDDDVGKAIEKTKTRIKDNYNKTQRYYNKISTRPSIDYDNESTSSGEQEMTEIEINASDTFLRSATFNDEESGEQTTGDKIKNKLISVTQSAFDNAKDGIEDLLNENSRRKKKKAAVGTVGGLVIFALTVLLIILVKKI